MLPDRNYGVKRGVKRSRLGVENVVFSPNCMRAAVRIGINLFTPYTSKNHVKKLAHIRIKCYQTEIVNI
jgi:hypothetical protein